MSRGSIIMVVLAAWVLTGFAVAVEARRRGHFLASWLLLGAVFGPFTLTLLRWSRDRDRRAGVVEIAGGARRPGPVSVLVGIDGSPESHEALTVAVGLLGERLGRLTVAAVLDFDTAADLVDAVAAEDRARVAARLRAAAALVEDRVGPVSETILAGRPCDALRDHALATGCSLIAVGPRGRGVSKALLGSTAAALSRGCPVPVLIVSGATPGAR